MSAPDATLSILQNVLCTLSDAAQRTGFAVDLCLMHCQECGPRLVMRHPPMGPRAYVDTVKATCAEYDVLISTITRDGQVEGYEFHAMPSLESLGCPLHQHST